MRNVVLFVGLTYAFSWGAWLPILIYGGEVLTGHGWPTHMPGLLGPAIAAFVVAGLEGRTARKSLFWRCRAWPHGTLAWMVMLSPLAMIGTAFLVDHFADGRWPDLSALGQYSGLPELGVLPVLATVLIVNGFGEEVGWRGFLLPRLQSRFGPLAGTLAVWPIWLVWHLPLFAFLIDFKNMGLATAVFGWGLGLLAGTVVLANVSHLAGGSVAAAAIWHMLFNAAAGSGLSPLAAAVATTCVMVWAVLIGLAAWRGRWAVLTVDGRLTEEAQHAPHTNA